MNATRSLAIATASKTLGGLFTLACAQDSFTPGNVARVTLNSDAYRNRAIKGGSSSVDASKHGPVKLGLQGPKGETRSAAVCSPAKLGYCGETS